MLFEKFRHHHRVLGTAAPRGLRSVFIPRISRKAASGSIEPPEVDHVLAHLLDQRLASGRRARDHIRMPRQIFRRAVHHQIESHVERFLQHGRGERVVDDRDQVPLFRERHAFCRSTRRSVGLVGRLHVNSLRARVHQPLDPGQIGLHVPHHNSKARKNVAQQAVAAAVELPRGDQFVARPQHRQQRARNGRASRSRHHRRLARPPAPQSSARRWRAWDCRSACRCRRSFSLRPSASSPRCWRR